MSRGWRRLSAELDRDYGFFAVWRERFESGRTGKPLTAIVLETSDWVNIVALTPDEQVVTIEQFRYGTQQVTLEIPGGLIDPGEAAIDAARRELREETGYDCARLLPLGSVSPNPAFMRNRLHVFLAEGCVLAGEQEQDPGEDIRVVLRPLAEVDALIASGEMDHALVNVAFQKLALHRAGHSVR